MTKMHIKKGGQSDENGQRVQNVQNEPRGLKSRKK